MDNWNNGYNNSNHFIELQIWREMDNNTYHKINGTMIDILSMNETRLYEFNDFDPIEFQTGDVFGMYVPPLYLSTLHILSEQSDSHLNYFLLPTEENVTNTVVITPSATLQRYHPLVTGKCDEYLSQIIVLVSVSVLHSCYKH